MKVIATGSDGKVVEFEEKYASQCRFLSKLLEELTENNEIYPEQVQDVPIQVPLSGKVLEKVLEFIAHDTLRDGALIDEATIRRYDLRSDSKLTDEWDIQFCKMDQLTLFEVIKGANYLGAIRCLDVLCKSVAMMIMGKSSQQIRDLFGIENDWSPEEEEKVRDEIKWILN